MTRVNIGCGDDIRDGYINIDAREIDHDDVCCGDATTLEWICEENSVDEMLANNILQFFPFAKIGAVLQDWIGKLKIDGVLSITVPDAKLVARQYAQDAMSDHEYAATLFGSQGHKFNFAKSCIVVSPMIDLIERMGMKLERRFYNGPFCYMEFRKVCNVDNTMPQV